MGFDAQVDMTSAVGIKETAGILEQTVHDTSDSQELVQEPVNIGQLVETVATSLKTDNITEDMLDEPWFLQTEYDPDVVERYHSESGRIGNRIRDGFRYVFSPVLRLFRGKEVFETEGYNDETPTDFSKTNKELADSPTPHNYPALNLQLLTEGDALASVSVAEEVVPRDIESRRISRLCRKGNRLYERSEQT